MKKILQFAVLLLCLAGLAGGCGQEAGGADTVTLYSDLAEKFVQAMADKYNARQNDKQKVKVVVAKKDGDPQAADVVLGSTDLLRRLADQDALQPVPSEYADLLPETLKDKKDRWLGVFYDPAVILVNQAYSRQVGQENIEHWLDLADLPSVRISMENLTNKESTKNFLAAASSHMGQDACLDFFRKLRPRTRFAKYAISPVRMAATGDADIAITRRSQVFKYLQNDFPAYAVIPEEGSPIELFGAGLVKASRKGKKAVPFVNWLLQDSEARTVLTTERCGFLPVLPQGRKGQVIDTGVLWTNTFYKDAEAVQRLSDIWMKEIRIDAAEVEN